MQLGSRVYPSQGVHPGFVGVWLVIIWRNPEEE
jgi:hypothetical protein